MLDASAAPEATTFTAAFRSVIGIATGEMLGLDVFVGGRLHKPGHGVT